MSKIRNERKNKKYQPLRGSAEPNSCIIAVGGGKGGVGKSFVSSNLAIFLANMGHRTVIIDFDLGAANAHTSLGERLPSIGISQFLEGKVESLAKAAVATKFPSLRLISGGNDELDIANLDIETRSDLMSAVYNLDSDFIVLDLSAGTHQSTVDFFLMAQRQLLVFTPEPSSIENAYRFMKTCYYRKIRRFERQLGLTSCVKNIMDNKEELGIRSPADLMNEILKEKPAKGKELADEMQSLCFDIVLNQTRTHKDVEIGESVKSVSKKFFGLDAEFAGHLEYDNAVWQALRKHRPLLLEYPNSRLYSQFLNIAKSIAYSNSYKAVI